MKTERRVKQLDGASMAGVGVTLIERALGSQGAHQSKAATISGPPDVGGLRMTDSLRLADGNGSSSNNNLRISLASSECTQRDASQLVRAQYARQGYLTQDAPMAGERFTLLAYHGAQLVGTLSVALDASGGLRGDQLFKPELDALRQDGRRICEFTRFAVDPSIHSFAVLAALFHTSYLLAYYLLNVDDVIVEVNPRHTRFYMNSLEFQQLAGERMDPGVNAPAVLLRSRFTDIEQRIVLAQPGSGSVKREEGFFRYGFAQHEELQVLTRLAVALRLPGLAGYLPRAMSPLEECA